MKASDQGGYKEVSLMIEGEGGYCKLKYEKGGEGVEGVGERE